MRLIGFLVFLFVAGWTIATGAQTEFDKLVAELDPAIQAQINAVFDSQSELDVFREVQALKSQPKIKPS